MPKSLNLSIVFPALYYHTVIVQYKGVAHASNMIFENFNNINISSDIGTSPVGEDTKLIAKYAGGLEVKTVLDVGTGSGFIPIYLQTLGFNCEAIDINSTAINCARKNAKRNKVSITLYTSDLFQNVKDKFDLLVFNPPYGNVSSTKLSIGFEIIKSILPKENPALAKVIFQFIKKQRADLLKRFFRGCASSLNKNGKVLIFLHISELPLAEGFSFKIVSNYKDMRLVLINF